MVSVRQWVRVGRHRRGSGHLGVGTLQGGLAGHWRIEATLRHLQVVAVALEAERLARLLGVCALAEFGRIHLEGDVIDAAARVGAAVVLAPL